MRVIYYTRPSFLDTALPLIKELSRLVELHLMIELSPEQWRTSLFDVGPRPLESGLMAAEPLLRECFPPGVRGHWASAGSSTLVVHKCRRSVHPATWWVSHQAVAFVRNQRPDVVHLDDLSLRLALALPELSKASVVLGIHDPEAHSGENGSWRGQLTRWLTFGQTRHFVLHNSAQRSRFCARHQLSPSMVGVIPLGVLDIFLNWAGEAVDEDDHNILFFGRLSPYKGLETLYEAAPLVAREVGGLRLTVAGKPESGYLPPAPPQLPNGGRIELIDEYIPNKRLAELFQRASVVVCPYTDATQSGVVLTAYGFSKPVVATRTGGLPEYVLDHETGILVPPRDPDSLARALVEILSDSALKRRLQQGVEAANRTALSWAVIASKTAEMYEKVLSDGR